MDTNFQPVYPHHDLLIEIGQVEMDMDSLYSEAGEHDGMQPDLESRMQSLLEALDHLAV